MNLDMKNIKKELNSGTKVTITLIPRLDNFKTRKRKVSLDAFTYIVMENKLKVFDTEKNEKFIIEMEDCLGVDKLVKGLKIVNTYSVSLDFLYKDHNIFLNIK